jgi:hypothetical protein
MSLDDTTSQIERLEREIADFAAAAELAARDCLHAVVTCLEQQIAARSRLAQSLAGHLDFDGHVSFSGGASGRHSRPCSRPAHAPRLP